MTKPPKQSKGRPWDAPDWDWEKMTPKLWELYSQDQNRELREAKKSLEEERIRFSLLTIGKAYPEFTLDDGSRVVVEIQASQQNKYPEIRDMWRKIEAEQNPSQSVEPPDEQVESD